MADSTSGRVWSLTVAGMSAYVVPVCALRLGRLLASISCLCSHCNWFCSERFFVPVFALRLDRL
jgi:hypothetical protein